MRSGDSPTPELFLRQALATIDRLHIAETNLTCALGLPGIGQFEVRDLLLTLDAWASAIESYSRKSTAEAKKASSTPDVAETSFLAMVTFLKHPRDLGITYERSAVGHFNFKDARADFLYGPLVMRRGTCASLPVLFVAIGRRLGWPMHLAVAKRHVLCQWVFDDGTHVNLEGSCPGGGELYPDERYHRWPAPLTQEDLASGRYLRPLSRAEEFALFLEIRGHCLADNGRTAEAIEAYGQARSVAPRWAQYDGHVAQLGASRGQ
jgi:hypothetical protein